MRSHRAAAAAAAAVVAAKINSDVFFTPSISSSSVYSNFFVCLHVLDQSTWTCFALNKVCAIKIASKHRHRPT